MKSTKRQIILGALVVALGVAVYLNWALNKPPAVKDSGAGGDLPTLGDVINAGSTNIDGVEAILTENAEEYFATARISRQRTRETSIETMQNTINVTEDQQVKMTAAESVLKLAENIETEGRIENLVLAKGFADCMAYVDNNTANIVVATSAEGLTAIQAAQIYDIVVNECADSIDNINIIEMK